MRYTKTLDFCQACNRVVKRVELKRRIRAGCLPAGQNLFDYSTYEGTYWKVVQATYEGNLSMGPWLHKWIKGNEPGSDDTYSREPGSPTFSAQLGVLYETTEFDLTDWTSWVFSCEVGPKHDETTNLEVTYAITSKSTLLDDSVVYTTQKTYSAVKYQQRIWWCGTQADLAGLNPARMQFSIYCTSDGWTALGGDNVSYFWIDNLQLENDVLKPGNFVQTTGSAIDLRGHVQTYQVGNVCPECKEKLPTHSGKYKPHTVGTPVIIPNDIEVP